MASGLVPRMGTPAFQCLGELERRLSTELYDDTMGLFEMADLQNVFQGQGFEVQSIARVIIGTDSFRITIHNGFIAIGGQSLHRMNAAVIKLYALTDPIRTTAQNDNFLRSVGSASFSTSRYYRVCASNSAAQVSIRL